MENETRLDSLDLMTKAEELLREASDSPAERTKKAIPSPDGLQLFLLYVRAGALVPKHQVKGPITVQTLLGHAQMTADEHSYDLPQGNIAMFKASVPHDVLALTNSVLLVTHAQPLRNEHQTA